MYRKARIACKKEAKKMIERGHYTQYQGMFWILIALSVINSLTFGFSGLIIAIPFWLMSISDMFACIDLARNSRKYNGYQLFEMPRYLMSVIGMSLYHWMIIFLWNLLACIPIIDLFFIVPECSRGLAYSQAVYIYRDYLNSGNPITYREAMRESMKLMDGHKMELFELNLSFLGWYLLSAITFNLVNLYVLPYYYQTRANYYVYLTGNGPIPRYGKINKDAFMPGQFSIQKNNNQY